MSEAYMITIYRRNGKLFVSPAVGSTLGFENLPGVIAVGGREELVPALEAAHAQVEAAWRRPKAERFPEGPEYFLAAGAASWTDFLRGTVAVSVRYGTKDTKITVLLPDPNRKWLEAADKPPSTTYPVDLPLADAASLALKLLDEIPG